MLQSNDSQLETDVLGETVGPIVKQSQEDTALPATAWPLKMGLIGCSETSITTNLRRVTSRKSEELIYAVAGAYSHSQKIRI